MRGPALVRLAAALDIVVVPTSWPRSDPPRSWLRSGRPRNGGAPGDSDVRARLIGEGPFFKRLRLRECGCTAAAGPNRSVGAEKRAARGCRRSASGANRSGMPVKSSSSSSMSSRLERLAAVSVRALLLRRRDQPEIMLGVLQQISAMTISPEVCASRASCRYFSATFARCRES